jgi:hypothetical protein
VTPRRWIALAAPVVVALLVAAGVLWTRSDPSRQGDFCSRATAEITDLLRRTERSGNLDRDQAGHLAEALARIELLDERRLTVGAPPEIDAAATTVREELPAYRATVEEAAGAGADRPDPPPSLQGAVAEVLATYYGTCI